MAMQEQRSHAVRASEAAPAASEADECRRIRRGIARMFADCDSLITALGDQTRQQIITALLEAPEEGLRVGQITELTNLSRPAVSHHLKVLKDAGAVGVRKRGTMNFYYLNACSPQWEELKSLVDVVCATGRKVRAAGGTLCERDLSGV